MINFTEIFRQLYENFLSNMPAQMVGVVASIISIITFQQKTQKRIVYMQLAASTCWTIHFLWLGAFGGGILNIIAVFRSYVFAHRDKPWARKKAWLACFAIIIVIAGILPLGTITEAIKEGGKVTFSMILLNLPFADGNIPGGLLEMLPITGMMLTTAAFWITDAKKVRRISLPSSPCWLIYDASKQSWSGVFTEIFVMTSILIAMYRLDRKKKSVKENQFEKVRS
ncbi:MAG: YgjV family protein [Bacillota bacterium]|nr:YgjV family protein [Bacillota bacterium]